MGTSPFGHGVITRLRYASGRTRSTSCLGRVFLLAPASFYFDRLHHFIGQWYDMRREGLGHMHLRNFTETIWQDLCFGARRLAKSPGYTLTVILTLGLGIGLNSAIFSVVRGILLREPPVKQPERILVVTTENLKKGVDRFPMWPREF